MIWTLAVRHLLVRPGRALVLLAGFSLGVAVMIVLLSVGDAMLEQSRDPTLLGGGDLVAVPEGIDLEALRSGGLAGMFFGINGARFVSRQLLGGPRHRDIVAAVSPVIDQKLLSIRVHDSVWAVRASADIPSRAADAGAGLHVLSGDWRDTRSDSAWIAPDPQTFYNQIDHFHRPAVPDSSWAEWDYFNVSVSDREWWYITLLVAGEIGTPQSGGEVLVTHRARDGSYRRFVTTVAASALRFDTTAADLRIGAATLTQRDGVYHMRGASGSARFDVELLPSPRQYFPPVELGSASTPSGYVVPALSGTMSGSLCDASGCEQLHNAPAYHDHNWGTWRDVTWEWGTGHGGAHALLYGGVISGRPGTGPVPYFLALEDSLGVEQIYRFDTVERIGRHPVATAPATWAPDSLDITAARGVDTLRVRIRVTDATASHSPAAGPRQVFLQLRGTWSIAGTAAGQPVADSGVGAFETWVR